MKKLCILAATALIGSVVSATGQTTFPFSNYFIDSPIASFDELQSGIYILQGYAKDSGSSPHEGIFRSTASNNSIAATYDASIKEIPTTLDDDAILWEITVIPATEDSPKTFTVKSVKEGYYWSFCGSNFKTISGNAYVNGDITKTSGTYEGTADYHNLHPGDDNIAHLTFADNEWNHTMPDVAPTLAGPRFVVVSHGGLRHANNPGIATSPGIPAINLTKNNANLNWWNISTNDTGTSGTQAWIQFIPVKPYPPYQSPTLNAQIPKIPNTNGGRYTGNIIVDYTDYMGQAKTITIGDLQISNTEGFGYYDKSDVVFTASPGSTFSLSNNSGEGSAGMQKCLYIDWNNDFQFGPNAASDYVQTNYVVSESTATAELPKGTILTDELVFYHALKHASQAQWYNKNGNCSNQSAAYNLQIQNIMIPEGTPEGNYRVRYKYSWNDINPYTPANSAGIVVDFTLRVRNHAEPISYNIDCGGIIIRANGVTGDPVSIGELHGLPDFFEPNDGETLITPGAGETLIIPGKWQFPFNFDTPYFLVLRQNEGTSTNTNRPYHNVYYEDPYVKNQQANANQLTLNPYLLWYMKDGGIENNTKVVTLHNLSTDQTFGVHADDEDAKECVINEDVTKFAIHKNGNGFGLRIASSTNAYINEFYSNGTMAIWAHANGAGDIGGRMWLNALTDDDFNVQDWIAHDGFTYYLDADKLDAARINPTLENLIDLFAYEPKVSLTREDVIHGVAKDSHFTSLVNILCATSLFTQETASDAIYSRLNIAEESDDYSAELVRVLDDLATLTGSAIVMPYLDGKKVAFRNHVGGGHITKGSDNKIGNARYVTQLNPDAVWEIASNGTSFTMKNMVTGQYAKGLEVTNDANEAVAYELVNDGVLSNGSFAIANPAIEGPNKYLNNNSNDLSRPDILRYFTASDSNPSSFWYIDLVTEESEQSFVAHIMSNIKYAGTNPGEHKPEDPANYATLDEVKPQILKYDFFDDGNLKYNDVQAVYDYIASLALRTETNPVDTDRYIRIINQPGYYFTAGTGDSHNLFAENYSNNAIFLYYGNHLISYTEGSAIKGDATNDGDNGMLTLRTNVSEHADDVFASAGAKIRIDAAAILSGEEDATTGRFYVGYNGDNHTRKLYSEDAAVNAGNNISTSISGYKNYTFKIEYVNELPVQIHGDGIGSLYCGMNVRVPEDPGYVVYVASINEYTDTEGYQQQDLETTLVNAGKVIPAFTPILIQGEAGKTVQVPVTTDAANYNVTTHSKIKSHFLVKNASPDADHVLVVKKDVAPDAQTMNVRRRSGSEVNTPVSLHVVSENETVPAGSVAIMVHQENSQLDLKNGVFTASLGGSTSTTGIEEVGAKADAAATVVYDLQGRRLAAPVKGFNIINGRKVFLR